MVSDYEPGFQIGKLGMSPQMISQIEPKFSSLPALSISGIQSIGSSSAQWSGQFYQNLFFSATHMRGSHSIRAGTEIRVTQTTSNNLGNLVPAYTFWEQLDGQDR